MSSSEVKSNNPDEPTLYQRMISACSGSLLTSVFVTPFDVIKTRLQTTNGPSKCMSYCNCCVEELCMQLYGNHKHGQNCYLTPKQRFSSTMVSPLLKPNEQVLWRLIRQEGPKSLWSGLSPTLAMAAPSTMIYYPTYELIRDKLAQKYDSPYVPGIAGGISRAFAVVVVSPLDLIRTKMQSKKMTTQELLKSVRTSVKHEGLRSMYIGLVPTLIRDVPFSITYWFLYEKMKKELTMESLFVKSFLSGIFAGGISACMTHPFDVVKTKRQVMLGSTNLFGDAAQYTSLSSITKNTFKSQGAKGFFVGLTPRICKVAPACAIMISSYELGKSFFAEYNRRK